MEKVYCYDPKKRMNILSGEIDGKVFIKRIKHVVHYMRKYHGYGIQKEVFYRLPLKGVEKIRFILSKDLRLEISFEKALEVLVKGEEGHGDQIFIDPEDCTRIDRRQPMLF